MSAGLKACGALLALFSAIIFMWMVTPTEQTLAAVFPNVIIMSGFGSEQIDPISFDNNSLPELPAAQASRFNGIYQFDPMFYHKSLDRFIPWESRDKTHIFSCTLFCGPMNTSAKEVKLALVHTSPGEKRNLWYLLEFADEDANSPIVIARTKFRKEATYRVPWMTVTPGGEIKPRDLLDVHLITGWDAFRFDTPLKWGCTVAFVALIALLCHSRKDKDD
mmetsp:Transcript_71350/g.204726  ORF Transcript_71350/g.204726 Transcript_71350/m.204726 type:complete len:220 (-) Transcript_71350:118-777(-)